MNAGIKVRPGVAVVAEGRRYQIEKVLNLESVIARDLETGALQRLLLTQLLPAPPLTTDKNVTTASPDPQQIPIALPIRHLALLRGDPVNHLLDDLLQIGQVHVGLELTDRPSHVG